MFIVFLLLSSCSKNDEIKKKVIDIFLNHSCYDLNYNDLNNIIKNDISDIKKIDRNFNIISLTRGRTRTNKRIEISRSFYPFIIKNDSEGYKIIYVFKNSKAEKNGLTTGRLYKINNEEINDKTHEEIEYLLEASDSVDITFQRGEKIVSMKIEKEIIYFPSVWGFAVNKNTGYIRIFGFLQKSDVSFKDIYMNLTEKPMNTIVLDLRNLKMGDYQEAAKIAGFFVNKNNVVYYIKSSKKIYNQIFISDDGSFNKVKIIIIVNSRTASLGEILAMTLKENNNAVLFGEKTSGQLYITKMFELPDKKMCNLSVGKLYPPSGRDIKEVIPDYYYKDTDADRGIFGLNYILDTDPIFNEIAKRYMN